jgi:hypothetical protein
MEESGRERRELSEDWGSGKEEKKSSRDKFWRSRKLRVHGRWCRASKYGEPQLDYGTATPDLRCNTDLGGGLRQ